LDLEGNRILLYRVRRCVDAALALVEDGIGNCGSRAAFSVLRTYAFFQEALLLLKSGLGRYYFKQKLEFTFFSFSA